KKDRVFFFVDYQATRLRQGTPFNEVVPSIPERSGDFSDQLPRTITDPLNRQPYPGNIIPADRISQQGKFLSPYFPVPNLIQGTTFRPASPSNLPPGQTLGAARVDARLTDNDSFTARYSVSSNYEVNPNPFPAVPATNLHSKAQDYTVR